MSALWEAIGKFFSLLFGHRESLRADFNTIADKWESLAGTLDLRLTSALSRIDALEIRMAELKKETDECLLAKAKMLIELEQLRLLIKSMHKRKKKQ